MSTYQELKGLKVKYLSADTSGDRTQEGELFYNSTDLCVSFPLELTEELNWNRGDIIQWDIKGNGIVLTKLNAPNEYEEFKVDE